MRGRHHFSVACRRENQEVVVTAEPVEKSILGRLKWLNKPFLRGTLAMIDTLVLGMKALMFSANIAMEDAQAADAAAKAKREGGSKTVKSLEEIAADVKAERASSAGSVGKGIPVPVGGAAPPPAKSKPVNDITLGVTLFLGLALGIVLFMYLPAAATFQLKRFFGDNRLWLTPIEGLIKIVFFIGYVWAISRMKDIRRVFQYHGAEHKTINAYEAGEELTVENVDKHTTLHVRCGTSFLLVVLVTSILVFMLIPWNFNVPNWQAILMRVGLKLMLLPIVAGIGYEIIKFAGRRKDSPVLRFVLAPGLLMQRITTQPPSKDQVEIAITALKSVFEQEKNLEPAANSAETHHH